MNKQDLENSIYVAANQDTTDPRSPYYIKTKANNWVECPNCLGTGDIMDEDGDVVICPTCDGAGEILEEDL